MSKLNFASVSEAYSIGSEQIKNTQSEIAKLKKIIEDSAIQKNNQNNQNNQNNENSSKNELNVVPQQPISDYKRIGNPDNTQATFCKPDDNNKVMFDDFDYTFLRIMRHPRFDEIVKNYVIIQHPEWLLNNTHYVPNNQMNPNVYRTKETFGSSDYKNYIIFFIVSMILYLGISFVLKQQKSN